MGCRTANPEDCATVFVGTEPYKYICILDPNLPPMEQIANAQLIANAPTMLFVLETVEQYFRCKNFVTETGIDNMLVLMRETIANSIGGSR